MNPLTQTRNQLKMNERELEMGVSGTKNSWHMEYKDSAWCFLGGLPFEMTEGDVICMFSQYGEVVHINLIRDHGTGKSKGFGFICYMDQRSTILAVDNLNGVKVLGRMIRVDHVHQYKLPKDLEKLDQDKRKLFEEGCAPKEISAVVSDSSEEEEEMVVMKEKKKQKKKKRRHSTSSESETSESEEEERRKESGQRKGSGREKGKEDGNSWDRGNHRGKARDTDGNQEKSLEDRLRAMANYVKQGGGGSQGDSKRVTAKDMFEKEERVGASNKTSSSQDKIERKTKRSERSRSLSQKRRGESGYSRKQYRRSVSGGRQNRRSRSKDIGRTGNRRDRSLSRDKKDRSRSRDRRQRSVSQERRGRRDRTRSPDKRRNRRTASSSSSSS